MESPPIVLRHSFRPEQFQWLWAKYVTGVTAAYHCTNCLSGPYSRRFSAHNPAMVGSSLVMDEAPAASWGAIYLCGVARSGYPRTNYPHNVHVALVPRPGATATWSFEGWSMTAEHAALVPIPDASALPFELQDLPPAFTTCRIFRWAMVEGRRLVPCDARSPRVGT